ncbi:MAG: putative zinc-binding metallopeptidase [Bacteroidales bacterium]|nr:putative zinc-binding metallopeptidase [Bacteroidales bacterium]
MNKNIFIIAAIATAIFSATACQEDALDPNSVITADSYEKNAFDKWLEVNYVNPYNIDFKYRFEMNESDMNYYTVPADYDSAIKMAHLVKYLCIDTYDEVAGISFTRGYFPKMFFLIGEWEYRNNGTFILGTAEGGKKILLSGINYLPDVLAQGADALNYYYIKTIHHEFTHILNQTKDFPVDFKLITGSGYVADSWSEEPYNTEFGQNGFISSYAQYSEGEDFAEMLSIYVTNPQSYWDEQLKAAGAGADAIRAKLDVVRLYMKDSWGIDIDQLRATVLRRQADITAGKIDLTNISID